MKAHSDTQAGVASRRPGWRAAAVVVASALAIGGAALGAHAVPSITLAWDGTPAVHALLTHVAVDPIVANFCTSEATTVQATVTSDDGLDMPRVRTFAEQTTSAACPGDGQTVSWDGTDDANAMVPAGRYTLHLSGPDTNELTLALTVEGPADPEPTAEEPTNSAPVAADDSATVEQDQVLTVAAPGVLANDTDADNDPLTAAVVAQPAHGSVELASDGAYVYTPEAGFVGDDSFTYVANDGTADSDPATVTITVTAAEVVTPLAIQLPVPVIEGLPTVGQTLTAAVGEVTPAEAALAYQWNCGDAAIADATAATYTPAEADVDCALTVTVTATLPDYPKVSQTSAPVTVATAVPPAEALAITNGGTAIAVTAGQTGTLTVTTNAAADATVSFAVVSGPDWATVDTASGVITASPAATVAAGSFTVTVSATVGDETVEASYSITVADGVIPTGVTASPTALAFPGPGGTATFTVTSSTAWKLTGLPKWATASVTSGPVGTTTVTVTAKKYSGLFASRHATVTVSAGNYKATVTLNQTKDKAGASGGTLNWLSTWFANVVRTLQNLFANMFGTGGA